MTKKEILQYIKSELDNNENAEIYLDVDDYKVIVEVLEQQPSEDCISRAEIISKISEYADGFENGGYFSGDSVEDAIMACVGMADELPSVTPTTCIAKVTFSKDDLRELVDEKVEELAQHMESRWVPVSERLPNHDEYIKNNGLFIVSDGNRSYSEYYDIYDKRSFGEPTMSGFRVDRCVIAWMSLPEPYKEEVESEE